MVWLDSAHQTHYEQMGKMRGFADVDGKRFELDLYSMRDHSYGEKIFGTAAISSSYSYKFIQSTA